MLQLLLLCFENLVFCRVYTRKNKNLKMVKDYYYKGTVIIIVF
jgi:hypothetical protein